MICFNTICIDTCAYWVDECIKDVSHHRYTQVRGICHNVFIDVEYDINSGTIDTIRSKHCSLDDTNCVQDYINNYAPLNKYMDAYYNPWNPTEIKYNIGYNIGAWVALGFPILFFVVMIGIMCYLEYLYIKKTCSFDCLKKKIKFIYQSSPPTYENLESGSEQNINSKYGSIAAPPYKS